MDVVIGLIGALFGGIGVAGVAAPTAMMGGIDRFKASPSASSLCGQRSGARLREWGPTMGRWRIALTLAPLICVAAPLGGQRLPFDPYERGAWGQRYLATKLAAFELAVELYSPDHRRRMTSASPEVRFIQAALDSVRSRYPVLDGVVPMRTLRAEFTRLGAHYYLSFHEEPSDPEILREAAEAHRLVRRLVEGCDFEESIRTDRTVSPPATEEIEVSRTTSWVLSEDRCVQPIASRLVELGLHTIVVKQMKEERRETLELWIDGGSDLQDMRHVRYVLSQSAEFGELARYFAPPSKSTNPGKGLLGLEAELQEDGSLLLTYSRRWGQCPMCAYRHEWRVRVTSLGQGFDRPHNFRIELVGESGSAWPGGPEPPP